MLLSEAAKAARVHVAGCPMAMIEDALRDAVIEFCRDSLVLHTGIVLSISAATTTISYTEPLQTVDVLDAHADGLDISVVSMNDPAADEDLDADQYVIRTAVPGQISITPTPAAAISVNLLVAVAPTRSADQFPDTLWDRFKEPLVSGALARLMVLPGKAWTSPDLAMYHRGVYAEGKRDATSEAHKNFTRPARRLRVRPA